MFARISGQPTSTPISTARRILAAFSALAIVFTLVAVAAPNAGAAGTSAAVTTNSIDYNHGRTSDGSTTARTAGWTGAGTTVAVIDTGVQSNHPYLMHNGVSKVVAEGCFVTPVPTQTAPDGRTFTLESTCPGGVSMTADSNQVTGSAQPCAISDPTALCTHGTHVAGVVAGEPNVLAITVGGVRTLGGFAGAAPGANLISIQVFGKKIITTPAAGGSPATTSTFPAAQDIDIIKALTWLYNHRSSYPTLTAINVSIASTSMFSTTTCDTLNSTTVAYASIIKKLRDANIATIVSAGNTATDDTIASPSCVSTAIAVAAIDDSTNTRWFTSPGIGSNISTAVSLVAPGVAIASSFPVANPAEALPLAMQDSGTSVAAPAVAGAWALLRQRFPTMSVTEVLAKLRAAGTTVTTTVPATPARGSVTYSIPRLQVDKALQNSAVVSTSAGDGLSCAVSADGTVHCAGANALGQLGNPDVTAPSSTTPVPVTGITTATAVATDGRTSCARLADGTARCWGANDAGQLGNATVTAPYSSTPVTVMKGASPLGSISSISIRGGVCALINKGASGTVSCWGKVGPNAVNAVPTTMLKKVSGVDTTVVGVTSADVAGTTVCVTLIGGALINGTLWCADRSATPYSSLNTSGYAVRVFASGATMINTATSVSLGNGSGCVVLTAGTAKCWRGALASVTLPNLGNGVAAGTSVNLTPDDVRTSASAPLTGISALDIGYDHACAIATNGSNPATKQLYCWGKAVSAGTAANNGTGTTFATRVAGTSLNGSTAISAGRGFTLGVAPAGTLPATRAVGWGSTATTTAYGFTPNGLAVSARSLPL